MKTETTVKYIIRDNGGNIYHKKDHLDFDSVEECRVWIEKRGKFWANELSVKHFTITRIVTRRELINIVKVPKKWMKRQKNK